MRLTLTLCLTLLLAPSVARAYDIGQDISAQPEIVEALSDANAYWGRAPVCPAGITVDVADFGDVPEAATAASCHITIGIAWLNEAPDRTKYCALFAHEYGHLLGYGHEAHSDDRDSVMVNRGTPHYCRTFNAMETKLPKPCRWPAWARATPEVRKLYAAGKQRKARAVFLVWRKRHPKSPAPGPCRAT